MTTVLRLSIDGYNASVYLNTEARSAQFGKFSLMSYPPFVNNGYFETLQEATEHFEYEIRKWKLKNPKTIKEWMDQIEECIESDGYDDFSVDRTALEHVLSRFKMWSRKESTPFHEGHDL